MLKKIKLIKQDFDSKEKILKWFYYFAINMPGNIGFRTRKWYIKKSAKKCGCNLVVQPEVKIRNIHKLTLGNNVQLGERSMIQAAGDVFIDDNTLIGPSVKIWSANHGYNDINLLVSEQGYEYKQVVIGKDVWVGANSIILPGTILSDKIVVAAGSVVGSKKYPIGSILMGNPARKLGERK